MDASFYLPTSLAQLERYSAKVSRVFRRRERYSAKMSPVFRRRAEGIVSFRAMLLKILRRRYREFFKCLPRGIDAADEIPRGTAIHNDDEGVARMFVREKSRNP